MTWAYRTISDSGLDSAVRKPPFIAINLLNKITRMNKEGKKAQRAGRAGAQVGAGRKKSHAQETVRAFSRQSTIIPAMIGHTCAVRGGRRGEGRQGGRLEWSVVLSGAQWPGVCAHCHQRRHGPGPGGMAAGLAGHWPSGPQLRGAVSAEVGFKLGDFVPTHTFTSHPKQAERHCELASFSLNLPVAKYRPFERKRTLADGRGLCSLTFQAPRCCAEEVRSNGTTERVN